MLFHGVLPTVPRHEFLSCYGLSGFGYQYRKEALAVTRNLCALGIARTRVMMKSWVELYLRYGYSPTERFEKLSAGHLSDIGPHSDLRKNRLSAVTSSPMVRAFCRGVEGFSFFWG